LPATPSKRAFWVALAVGCLECGAPPRIAVSDRCADASAVDAPQITGRAPACIRLVARDSSAATGFVELHRVASSPFTVSVDESGHQLFTPVITLDNLPALTDSTYVAWAVTPDLSREVKLGVVTNGRTEMGVVGLNQFLLMITAERSADVAKHSGPAILNGTAPSMALQPHDAPPITRSDAPAAMSMHGDAHGTAPQWVMPPMHRQVPQMAAGLEGLVPNAMPWMPSPNAPRVAAVRPREVLTLKDGDSLSLVAGLVRRTIAGRTVTMYGFNGQSPGPMIRVDQHSQIVVNFTNALDQPTSIHWHGVRLDNRFDGTPMTPQDAIAPGGTFRYVITFPDAGIYWYHPHVREDSQQDLGLYGNLFVRSPDAGFFAPADREDMLILDDFLVDEANAPVPYGADAATHALMGRFGNVFLVNGSPEYSLAVKRGDVARFFLTNASSTRVFNVTIPGARLKLVGGDVGLVARETWVSSVVIAPAERYVVDVRFDASGRVPLLNHVQGVDRFRGVFFEETDTLGIVTVSPGAAPTPSAFDQLRENASVLRDIERYRSRLAAPPDYTLQLTLDTAQTLPFELWQTLRNEVWPGTPVEWTGTMPMMDWLATSRQLRWVLRDSATGRENMNVAWRFRRGDVVRIRLVNDARILHPMQHPIHLHGQRFLVVAVDGDPMQHLVWKDTALVPAGSTVDLLVEMTNPGTWMLHCHIAEHMESGMHMVFEVAR
jgi:FtsP/CotA-like multicopper oxidase with cupredoxin domain